MPAPLISLFSLPTYNPLDLNSSPASGFKTKFEDGLKDVMGTVTKPLLQRGLSIKPSMLLVPS